MDSATLEQTWRIYLETLRVWGIRAVLAAYRLPADWSNIDAAVAQVGPLVTQMYAAASSAALTSTDAYLGLEAAGRGADYVADWRKGRPEWPTQLPGGTPVADWMAYSGAGIKRLIGDGMELDAAVEVSQARAAQALASGPLQQARSTTWNRMITDSLIAQRDVPPEQLRPWTDEVEQYANLWDGTSRRAYPGTWERWQRVPSPGACSFCLMLASRTNYTSADAAMYAGGSEGTERRNARGTRSGISRRRTSKMQSGERYHRSCRCTVRMVAKGDPVAISAADFDRLTPHVQTAYTLDVGATGVPMPPTAPWKRH